MAEQGFRLDEVDFDSVYRGESIIAGRNITFDVLPWDIGEPQPAVVELADSGGLQSELLDVGCGAGENAIYLASRGYTVTGIDGSETALEIARGRAAERGADVTFVHTDVTTMNGIEQRFSAVLDSALYHCLTAEQRDAYAEALSRVTMPTARLHLFCFADVGNEGFGLPMSVSQDDLHRHLGRHWNIRDIRLSDYTTTLTPDQFAGPQFQEIGISMDPARLTTDDQGRIIGKVWHLVADRA